MVRTGSQTCKQTDGKHDIVIICLALTHRPVIPCHHIPRFHPPIHLSIQDSNADRNANGKFPATRLRVAAPETIDPLPPLKKPLAAALKHPGRNEICMFKKAPCRQRRGRLLLPTYEVAYYCGACVFCVCMAFGHSVRSRNYDQALLVLVGGTDANTDHRDASRDASPGSSCLGRGTRSTHGCSAWGVRRARKSEPHTVVIRAVMSGGVDERQAVCHSAPN